MTVFLPDADATRALGVWLGERAFPGAWIALVGDLGAGKTALTKGIGEGLSVTSTVQSPTFVLVQEHEGRLRLLHADFYRLGDAEEIDVLGLDEAHGAVVVVEWADRFPGALPADHLRVELSGVEGRHASFHASGPRHRALLPERWNG